MLQVVKAEMVLWTAGFVLLTLIINAPLLPWVLRVTGLNKGLLGLPALVHTLIRFSPEPCRNSRLKPETNLSVAVSDQAVLQHLASQQRCS